MRENTSALYTVVLAREEMAGREPKIVNSRGEGERLQTETISAWKNSLKEPGTCLNVKLMKKKSLYQPRCFLFPSQLSETQDNCEIDRGHIHSVMSHSYPSVFRNEEL